MINQLGNYSLFIGLLISILIIFISLRSIKTNEKNISLNIFSLMSLQFLFVIISFSSLIYLFLVSDFSNEIVYKNSHTTKPIFYKISGTWGNHEGSLLLWLIVLSLFILIFTVTSKKFSILYRLLTILVQEIIIIGFFLFIIFTSNPFNYLYPSPSEGLGLNPILQDPALAIHPPILYLGYVGTSIIFSASLSALISKNINSEWAVHLKKWIFTSWIFLTLGIMLGSIWAYYELGWGGFWFWDPVENISLMPWFCLTALLHTVIVLEKRSILKFWTIILSIATFSLSMSGTFLVRSGILNSIHTFANDPSRGLFILIFLFFLTFSSIIIFFIYAKDEKKLAKESYIISKETAVLFNNWFMMFFLSVVLIGTTYPLFLEVLTGSKISIGPPFYQKLLIPFLIPFFIFMSIGPNLNWIKDKISKIEKNKIIFFIIALVISYIITDQFGVNYLFSTILLGSSFFLFFSTIKDFLNKNLKISQKISHFSFSLLIISILMNSILDNEIITNMRLGDEVNFNNKIIKFKSLETLEKNNYKTLIGEFEVYNQKGKKILFYPEVRIYNQPSILTSEADIKTNLKEDNFIVINLLKDDGYFNVRYQNKPFMIWIWISTVLMVFGGTLTLFKKNKK
tara:strand:+ start:6279 stop:8156 length:1878 start_codon:yes stop_codon:yes gene_type:complete